MTLLLNDPEESIEEKEYESFLYIRKIPLFNQNPLQKGIENLFEQDFINKVKQSNTDCFQFQTVGIEIKNFQIVNGKKQTICDWVCQNGTKDDFKNFEKIFEIIGEIVNYENNPPALP